MAKLKLEVVYTLDNATIAEIIQQALRDEGIACEIEGEHQAGLTGVLQVRLLVPSEDAKRARDFILEHEKRINQQDRSD